MKVKQRILILNQNFQRNDILRVSSGNMLLWSNVGSYQTQDVAYRLSLIKCSKSLLRQALELQVYPKATDSRCLENTLYYKQAQQHLKTLNKADCVTFPSIFLPSRAVLGMSRHGLRKDLRGDNIMNKAFMQVVQSLTVLCVTLDKSLLIFLSFLFLLCKGRNTNLNLANFDSLSKFHSMLVVTQQGLCKCILPFIALNNFRV